MGGSMTAHSAGLGKGTCFQWTVVAGLPREDPATLPPPGRSPENHSVDDATRHERRVLGMLRGKKLLVVERNTMLRQVLTRALVRWGCHVVAVASEAEAVKQLRIPGGVGAVVPWRRDVCMLERAWRVVYSDSTIVIFVLLRKPCNATCFQPHRLAHTHTPPPRTETVQQMLLEEYEGHQGSLPGTPLGQGQLRLQHAAPLSAPCTPGQQGTVEGPFDVVVADADAGLLLHGLIAADAGRVNERGVMNVGKGLMQCESRQCNVNQDNAM